MQKMTFRWWSLFGDECNWSLLTLRSDVLLWLVDVQLLLSVKLHPCPFALMSPRRSVEARLSGCCDSVLGLLRSWYVSFWIRVYILMVSAFVSMVTLASPIVILDCLKGWFYLLRYEIISSFCQCLSVRLRGLWQLELGSDLRDGDVSPYCQFQRSVPRWDVMRCPSFQVDEWALRLCAHISN